MKSILKLFTAPNIYNPSIADCQRAPVLSQPQFHLNIYSSDDDSFDTTELSDSEDTMSPQDMDAVTDAGGFNIPKLKRFCHVVSFPWLVLALSIITECNVHNLGIKEGYRRERCIAFDFEGNRRRTLSDFEPFLDLLEHWNVLESANIADREFACAASKFFCVLKSNGKLRAIFDSRMAGELGDRPPPVNLPSINRVIETGAKSSYFWTADFKHWFYQISICEKLREFFVVKCMVGTGSSRRQVFRRMKVLPQGWSWSPFIAQSIGWSVILYRDSSMKDFFDEDSLKRQPNLPSYVEYKEFRISRWPPSSH